jgi:alginate O-acetyltransferase complex protein AlgI
MLGVERSQGKHGFFARLPRPVQIALTFIIVVFAWVFFRARDLPVAIAYCKSMLGLGGMQVGEGLVAGVIYKPYYLGSMILAALITWGGMQTWDWTRTLTAPKAALIFILFWLSLLAMTTQSYNPFIYFIF